VNGKRLKSKILVNNDILSLGDAELVYLLQQVRNSRPTGEVVMDKPALPRSGGSSIVRRYLKHSQGYPQRFFDLFRLAFKQRRKGK
jgi:hypothetical protein